MLTWRRHKFALALAFIFLTAAIIFSTIVATQPQAMPVLAPANVKPTVLFWPGWKDVLTAGIPLLGLLRPDAPTVTVEPVRPARGVFTRMVHFFTAIDPAEPRSFLAAEIPLLGWLSLPSTVKATVLPDFPQFDAAQLAVKGQPLVGIYHTHTSESFIPTSGRTHSPGGTQGDIVQVGAYLTTQLEKNGIPTVQSKTIHDYPSFMKAYGVSEETAKKMLAAYTSLQMLFDIHRDAAEKGNTTVTINGRSAARIVIVVATGHEGLPQPHWQQNYAFAKLLEAKMNQHFPGLSGGIRLDDWRYNQHLHPRALLLEVGCQENDLVEEEYSMSMLADIIAEIFLENRS